MIRIGRTILLRQRVACVCVLYGGRSLGRPRVCAYGSGASACTPVEIRSHSNLDRRLSPLRKTYFHQISPSISSSYSTYLSYTYAGDYGALHTCNAV